MMVILSPAKNINFKVDTSMYSASELLFTAESSKLLKVLKKFKVTDLQSLMEISKNLAELNFQRFQEINFPLEKEHIKPAFLVFNGEAYLGLQASTFNDQQIAYAQNHLRILSGFYGLLRPMDGIAPYRLEMGTAIEIGKFKNLYAFWGEKLKKSIEGEMDKTGQKVLVNLASNEYSKVLNLSSFKHKVVQPLFYDYNQGQYKMISVYAKRARGLMTAFLLKNKIETEDEIKHFDVDGYQYNDRMSKPGQLVFTRG